MWILLLALVVKSGVHYQSVWQWWIALSLTLLQLLATIGNIRRKEIYSIQLWVSLAFLIVLVSTRIAVSVQGPDNPLTLSLNQYFSEIIYGVLLILALLGQLNAKEPFVKRYLMASTIPPSILSNGDLMDRISKNLGWLWVVIFIFGILSGLVLEAWISTLFMVCLSFVAFKWGNRHFVQKSIKYFQWKKEDL